MILLWSYCPLTHVPLMEKLSARAYSNSQVEKTVSWGNINSPVGSCSMCIVALHACICAYRRYAYIYVFETYEGQTLFIMSSHQS
jgi:hypothetical protein